MLSPRDDIRVEFAGKSLTKFGDAFLLTRDIIRERLAIEKVYA
jgi:hypothetical protein